MIVTANQYVPPINEWSPEVDMTTAVDPVWHSWYKTEENEGTPPYGPPYNVMPYSWSGFDTPADLKNDVEKENNPLPAGGYGTSQYGYCDDDIAGIDCSGYVIICWGLSNYDDVQDDLVNYALEIDGKDLKEGDLLRKPGHSILYVSGTYPNCNIYESQADARTGANYPGVVHHTRDVTELGGVYTPYSIFPQFSDESPEDGEVVELSEDETTIDISLTIKASGRIVDGGVKMFIRKDGEPEKSVGGITLEDKEEDHTWELKKEDLGSEEGIENNGEPNVKEGGNFTVRVVARNDIAGNGYKDEYEWKFTVEPAPPIVKSTDPANNSRNVSVDKPPISFTFSKPMDLLVTNNAIQTSFSCGKTWSGDKKVELKPNDYLDYCKEYTVTITDAAVDTGGVHLDGNNDGDAGDDYIFKFTTEPPDVNLDIDPAVANVEEGQSLRAELIANGNRLKKEIECRIDFNSFNSGGWDVSGFNEETFSLSPGEQYTDNFTIKNKGASVSLRVLSQIPVKCDIVSCEGFYWSAQGHQHDHPDENQSPGKMEYPTPWITRTQPSPAKSQKLRADSILPVGLPDIGILLSGWADVYGHILGKYGISTLPVKPDLKILNNEDVNISDSVKLLVIGSAGLKGFNSQEFK